MTLAISMPDARVHKFEIATRQLELACTLFAERRDPIGVLTLAGAAEEILGALLRRQGGQHMVEHLVELGKKVASDATYQDIIHGLNLARNAAKHATDPSEDLIVVDFEGEALAMLGRALVNYARLKGELSGSMIAVQALLREIRE